MPSVNCLNLQASGHLRLQDGSGCVLLQLFVEGDIGGHFLPVSDNRPRRKRLKRERQELRLAIEKAAGLLDEVAETVKSTPAPRLAGIDVTDLRKELNAIRTDLDALPTASTRAIITQFHDFMVEFVAEIATAISAETLESIDISVDPLSVVDLVWQEAMKAINKEITDISKRYH